MAFVTHWIQTGSPALFLLEMRDERKKHYVNTVFLFFGYFGQLYFWCVCRGMWFGSRKQIKNLRFQLPVLNNIMGSLRCHPLLC